MPTYKRKCDECGRDVERHSKNIRTVCFECKMEKQRENALKKHREKLLKNSQDKNFLINSIKKLNMFANCRGIIIESINIKKLAKSFKSSESIIFGVKINK